MPSSRALLALLRKELVTAVTNNVFVVLFGIPIILSAFLGLAFAGESRSAAPAALVFPEELQDLERDVRAIPTIRVVGTYSDAASALAIVREGRAVAVIDFTLASLSSQGLIGLVRVTMDDTRPVAAEVVRSSIQAWLLPVGGAQVATVEVSLLRGVTPRDTTVPLWMLLSAVTVSMGSVVLLVTDEKEHKTLDALLVTPVGAAAIVLAKTTLGVATIVAMCSLIVVLNQTTVAQPFIFAFGLVLGASGLVCLGLLIGTAARNPAGAASFGSLAVPILVLPVLLAEFESTAVAVVAQVLPTYHLNAVITVATFGGGSISTLLPHLTYMSVFALLTFLLAIVLLDRRAA